MQHAAQRFIDTLKEAGFVRCSDSGAPLDGTLRTDSELGNFVGDEKLGDCMTLMTRRDSITEELEVGWYNPTFNNSTFVECPPGEYWVFEGRVLPDYFNLKKKVGSVVA